ncbi:DUF1501 domain-containing protein [Zavarzinella formosa]|uniref:DUF1501 domain-containing protein n=1 Tax=Zavarzinella formosa TaxID=360055 RepID=UPI0003071907|nr:DUF1501 domain-containing protein [Zavarzinella formosa]
MSVPNLLKAREQSTASGKPTRKTSVIMFWLSGGPSHLDMWDPKPNAPAEVRGPFGSISTKVPGIQVSEHLPLQASIMDRLTLIRSVDCRASNHTPITLQAGNALARRTEDGKDGGGYPSMGSVVARYRGPNDPALPAFIGLADSWKADVWGAGHMGSAYEPVQGTELAGRLAVPQGITISRLEDRDSLRHQFDRLQNELDTGSSMTNMDRYGRQAVDMVVSGKAQKAFRVDEESDKLRDAYGRDSIGEKALLARRLVEAGSTYVLVSGAWGYFDHHGDDVRWGGIVKGLKPLLPRVDRVLYALINDLQARGLLDTTLVLMMGEFGRGPVINKNAGRDHWTNCMSMVVAGGGLPTGQVIGATDAKGYDIKERRVAPSDLAATVFQYLGIDLNTNWQDLSGRPIPIVTEGGKPIPELS